MGKKKHVAYVSTYTMGDEHGIWLLSHIDPEAVDGATDPKY